MDANQHIRDVHWIQTNFEVRWDCPEAFWDLSDTMWDLYGVTQNKTWTLEVLHHLNNPDSPNMLEMGVHKKHNYRLHSA